jgi:hypothetical protein
MADERPSFPPELFEQLVRAAQSIEEIRRNIRPVLEQLFGFSSQLKTDTAALIERLRPAIRAAAGASESIGPALQQLAAQMRQLPQQSRLVARLLAEHGWYIDPRLTPIQVMEWASGLY